MIAIKFGNEILYARRKIYAKKTMSELWGIYVDGNSSPLVEYPAQDACLKKLEEIAKAIEAGKSLYRLA